MTSIRERVVAEFLRLHGKPATHVVRAPGRVNLIGEHTDYNDGFVMPIAIDRATWIAVRPRTDSQVRLTSLDQGGTVEFAANAPAKGPGGWGEYPKGIAAAMAAEGIPLRGWDGVSACDVPMGAGLSSSASFELAAARAFALSSAAAWDGARMARIAQRAENTWVGVHCGIMDQLISALGQAGHALFIDCRDLRTEPIPMPAGVSVVVLDTMTRRGLVDSAYNERRDQCTRAAHRAGMASLRDVSWPDLLRHEASMDPTEFRRARHVVTENQRVLAARDAMRQGDARTLGAILDAGHASLRDDFAVTTSALDRMVDAARRSPGCLGARMTGAGFGGCALALVEDRQLAAFLAAVPPAYMSAGGPAPTLVVVTPSGGASADAL